MRDVLQIAVGKICGALGDHMAADEQKHKRGILFWISRLLMVVVILIVVLLVFGFASQALAEANDQRAYLPAGDLIDVGGYKLHLYCQGEGSSKCSQLSPLSRLRCGPLSVVT